MEKDIEAEEGAGRPYGPKLSEAQRREICDLYAAGKMKVTALAEKFGVSKSNISQLLKRERVIFASRLIDEAKAEVESIKSAPAPERDPTFADKRQARIEQTREESYNIIRHLRGQALRKLTEAEKLGSPLATLKETMNVFKRQIDMQISASRFMLEVLEANSHVNEAELPNIVIRDLSDEELRALTEADTEDELEDETDEAEDKDEAAGDS